MENPLLDAETLKMDGNGYIVELGKKPNSYDEIEGQYMGLFSIKKEKSIHLAGHYEALVSDRMVGGRRFNNMYMTDFIQIGRASCRERV